jgi:hypothetical protein
VAEHSRDVVDGLANERRNSGSASGHVTNTACVIVTSSRFGLSRASLGATPPAKIRAARRTIALCFITPSLLQASLNPDFLSRFYETDKIILREALQGRQRRHGRRHFPHLPAPNSSRSCRRSTKSSATKRVSTRRCARSHHNRDDDSGAIDLLLRSNQRIHRRRPERVRSRRAVGLPVELAAVGDCELRVCFVGGERQWLIRRDGQDVAEGSARGCVAATQQAESVAMRFQVTISGFRGRAQLCLFCLTFDWNWGMVGGRV